MEHNNDLRGIMDTVNDILSTRTAGLLAGGATAIFGWFADLTLTSVVGLIVSIVTLYFGYCKHRRDQILFQEELKRKRSRKSQ